MASSSQSSAPGKDHRSKGVQLHHLSSAPKDVTLLNQLRAIHNPINYFMNVEVEPLLHMVEVILFRAPHIVPGSTEGDQAHTKDAPAELGHLIAHTKDAPAELGHLIERHALIIKEITNEIVCRCSGSGDAHTTTLSILTMASEYTWEAKVILTLTAFASYYGEFWLIAQLYTGNSSAKPVAFLKQLPETMENPYSFKHNFEAIDNLLRATVNVTKCIAELKELIHHLYKTKDAPAYKSADAVIPRAAYWIIRSILACASQIVGLTRMTNEYISSTTEVWELAHLRMQLDLSYQPIDKQRQEEAYNFLVHTIDTPQVDNMKILRLLISSRDKQLPLCDCSTKVKVKIDVLRGKVVLLLITDLNCTEEEFPILIQLYDESRIHTEMVESRYEVLWLPVIDISAPLDDGKQTHQFEALQSWMPWYSPYHPSLINPLAQRYIKEVWHFNNNPMIVVLDPQGRVTNTNALYMMYIWPNLAYPFTTEREEALWSEEIWRLELIIDAVDPMIFEWIGEQKFICLYGGEDLNWIQKFTTKLHKIGQDAKIPLEMLYLGKSIPKVNSYSKIINECNEVIITQGLSSVLNNVTLVRYFWARLESMRNSKIQLGKTVQDDPILQEIVALMSFGASGKGWALISKGSSEPVTANDETFMVCLDNFDEWKEDIAEEGFVEAIRNYLAKEPNTKLPQQYHITY